MAIPVVIDTDLGNNIDDAVALSLAAVSPEIELVGVTTTWYEASSRALIARRLLGAWGRREVPVSAGDHPRYTVDDFERQSHFALHAAAVAEEPLSISSGKSALRWLSEVLEQRSITYVAIGPLTNLAHLLSTEPHKAAKIERVVFLGGWPRRALPEWNVMQDPEAAAIVIRSGIPISVIGYEVALSTVLSAEDIQALYRAAHPGARFLMKLYDLWNRSMGVSGPVMHDPLTVASLIDPGLIAFEEHRVDVQTAPGPAYGVMYRDAVKGRRARVAVSIDRERYFRLLVSRLAGTVASSTVVSAATSTHLNILDGIEVACYPGWRTRKAVYRGHLIGRVISGEGRLTVENRPIAGTKVGAEDRATLHLHGDLPQHGDLSLHMRSGGDMRSHEDMRLHEDMRSHEDMRLREDMRSHGDVRLREDMPVRAGDLFYVTSGEPYGLATETGMKVHLVVFDARSLNSRKASDHHTTSRLFDLPPIFRANEGTAEELESAGKIIERVIYTWRRPSLEHLLEAHGLLLTLLARLTSLAAKNGGEEKRGRDWVRDDLVQQVKRFLESHVEENVTLDDLSRSVGVSKYHLIRLFKMSEHMTPMQYYRMLKIRRSQSWLELGTLSIKEIAARLGYSSPAVFSRAFQAETRMSPGEYRRMIQR